MSWSYINYEFPFPQLFHKELLWTDKNCHIYFAFKLNDTDEWAFYAGNNSHDLETGYVLTAYGSSETLAQDNYLITERDTNGKILAILPMNFQAKYARLYVRTGSNVQIYEWHPSTYFSAHEIITGELLITDQLSDTPSIRVVKSGIDRLKIGSIDGYYGMIGKDSVGETLFELSDYQCFIGGWKFNTSKIYGTGGLVIDSEEKAIYTEDYTTGPLGSGWRIDTSKAEFQNIVARGKLSCTVFEKDTLSVINGLSLIGKGDILTENIVKAAGSVYPPAQTDTYVKATTHYVDDSSMPYMATDPTKSLIGGGNGTSWLAAQWAIASQRFHIDLGSAKIITKIYLENAHHIGGATTYGVREFTIWGSNSSTDFDDLTYVNDGTWTQIPCSRNLWYSHTPSNVADPQYATLTNITAYRYYAFKFINNWGSTSYMGVRRIELQMEDASNLLTGWTNINYDTFTSSGADITSAITAAGNDFAFSILSLISGHTYRVDVNLTLNSGTAPRISTGTVGGDGGGIYDLEQKRLDSGTDTYSFTYTGTANYFYIGNDPGEASNWSATFTIYDVTDSLTIEGNTTFEEGEVLRIKDGVNDEWLLVIDNASAPTYTVTRDLVASYPPEAPPEWKAGSAIVSMAKANGGFILIDASSTVSPVLQIFKRNSADWQDFSEILRLGNLEGFLGCGAGEWGIAIGDSNQYLKYHPDIGLKVKGTIDGSIITGSLISGSQIIGATIKTAVTGQRVEINEDGISLIAEGTSFVWGESEWGAGDHWGPLALAYINNTGKIVPFYINAATDYADFHFFNRTSDPIYGEVGDVVCVNGKLKICIGVSPVTYQLVAQQWMA